MSLAVAFVGKEIHVYRPSLVQLYFAVALSIFFLFDLSNFPAFLESSF